METENKVINERISKLQDNIQTVHEISINQSQELSSNSNVLNV